MADEVVPSVSDAEDHVPVGDFGFHAVDGEGDVPETGTEPGRSWWSQFIAWMTGQAGVDEARMERLDEAIARQPNAAPNYVLRGELYLQANVPDLAMEDFLTALELASDQFEHEDWGILSQVMRDRAERGLERARRRLRKR